MEIEISSLVKVRFSDCDPIGHLNNVKYIEYMLNAREDHVESFYGFTYEDYIKKTEEVMLEDGSLPELYFANSDQYNGNTPLGWSNAMYILAKEELDKSIRDTEFKKSFIFA